MLQEDVLVAGKRFNLDDFDIKIELGSLVINILWLRTEGFEGSNHIGTHCHSGYELHIIPCGSGVVSVNGESFKLSENSLYLTGPNVYHEQFVDPENPMKEYCIHFEITGGTGRRSSSSNTAGNTADDLEFIANTLVETRFWLGEDIHGCKGLFENIMEEMEKKYSGYSTCVRNYLTSIFINIARCFSGNRKSCYSFPVKDINDRRRIIIDKYFNNFDRKLSIRELSGMVGLSIRQLNRMLLKYYGMPFGEKLQKTRMIIAADLLRNSGLSIREVSELVGIPDPSYFSRVFKKHWGCSPSAFLSDEFSYCDPKPKEGENSTP